MADAMMKPLGEANGVSWYWAEPGQFDSPGVYYWDGTRNVLCVPYPYRAAPSPSAVQPTVEQAIVHLVEALAQSKGWLHAYADARVRDAIDSVAVQPLSEAQIYALTRRIGLGGNAWLRVARAVEAAHGIVTKEPT